MPDLSQRFNPEVQLVMFDECTRVITLKIGVVTQSQHGQIQVEVRDPVTDRLLALWSDPAFGFDELAERIRRAFREVDVAVANATHPFPA